MRACASWAALVWCGLAWADGPERSLTLQQALDTASERQPAIRQARATTEAARAQAAQALAPNLPQLNLGASYLRTTANFTARPGSVPGTGFNNLTVATPSLSTFDYFSANASVNQLIWDFGLTLGRYRAAEATVAAQEESEQAAQIQVALNVRNAYFTARAQADLVLVAAAGLRNQQLHQTQIQQFVEVGSRPRIDLAQARADVANARVQVLTAQNNYAISRARLNQSIGIADGIDFEVADPPPGPVPGEELPLEVLMSQALSERPESAAWEERLRAQAMLVQAARGSYWPSLGTSLNGTAAGARLGQQVPNLNLQLTLNWNLFGGGLTRAQVAEALAQQWVIEAQRDAFRLQVRVDLEQARLSVGAAKGTLAASEEALAASRERLTLAEGRYQEGVGNVVELGDAQVAFTAAGAQRVQALYGLATARAQLMAALGRR